MEKNNLYNPSQHGFRAGRSCLPQLHDNFNRVLEGTEKEKNVVVVYTGFAKVFDKCDHGIIAHKLKDFGITGKVARWIYSFLINRL